VNVKKIWALSLAVLLLGNFVDAGVAFCNIQRYGVDWEGNWIARRMITELGLVPVVFLVKGVLVSAFLYGTSRAIANLYPSRWVGIRLSTFFGFSYGVFLGLGGGTYVIPNAVAALGVELQDNTPVLIACLFCNLALLYGALGVLELLDARRRSGP